MCENTSNPQNEPSFVCVKVGHQILWSAPSPSLNACISCFHLLQTTVAVTTLCRAHHLASLMKRSEVMNDVMQKLIVLIPQLGLQCASAKDSPEDHGFLLDIPKFEQSGNLSSLTAIAAHHLKTGQVEDFCLFFACIWKICQFLVTP